MLFEADYAKNYATADRSRCCEISHHRTADQSHEYLGCNDFFGQGSSILYQCLIIGPGRKFVVSKLKEYVHVYLPSENDCTFVL